MRPPKKRKSKTYKTRMISSKNWKDPSKFNQNKADRDRQALPNLIMLAATI